MVVKFPVELLGFGTWQELDLIVQVSETVNEKAAGIVLKTAVRFDTG